ncbi:hypothetical protein AK812_SmicGene43372 [Symbiodinium microadriaticum]|uniref:Uncharacterized protein n=1 Tax=Symbiodinium microadriaticum TaxID=2951 RepID=A0A1Q9C171_SYMMI|nr:hypothetical protein AK812_SmicGene43372 [Symbiodinium microadriaticum]
MAVRRGASSEGARCTGSICDTSGLPDYDEIISNWTEYAMGASPRYLGQVGLSCDVQPRCFPVVLSVEAMADLQPPSSAVEQLSKDLNNHPKVPSLVIPVSEFQNGEVWIGDTNGSTQRAGIRGGLHPVEWPYLLFNSRLPHATEDWIGDRTVLLVYHIRDGWRMSVPDADLLSRRGFLFWTGDAETDPYLLTDEVMQEGPREAMLPL